MIRPDDHTQICGITEFSLCSLGGKRSLAPKKKAEILHLPLSQQVEGL